jgi:hypothetical protein
MTEKLKVTLAGKDYVATVPFTLGQLQDLRVGVMLPPAADPQEEVRRDYKRGTDIIVTALAPENPDITAEAIKGMRATGAEFNGAVTAILEASGLVTKKDEAKKDGATGEAPAEAKAAA